MSGDEICLVIVVSNIIVGVVMVLGLVYISLLELLLT